MVTRKSEVCDRQEIKDLILEKKKKNTPERESFVIAYGQGERHKVAARAHFLLRGLLSESGFLSLESFLPPRLAGVAAWLFSAASEGSLGFLVL